MANGYSRYDQIVTVTSPHFYLLVNSIICRCKSFIITLQTFLSLSEVIPGVMSCLTNSTLIKCLDLTVQHVQCQQPAGNAQYTPHHQRSIPIHGHTTFLNFADGILPFVSTASIKV